MHTRTAGSTPRTIPIDIAINTCGACPRALVVGMVHGLAGSAALILLSLEAADSVRWVVAYLAMFGAGSIAGMALVSAAIAVLLRLTSSRLTWAQGSLSTIVGIANIGLGCYIVYQSAIAGVMLGG
jgi:hypothetical protein